MVEDRSAATIHRIAAIIDINAAEVGLPAGNSIFALYPMAYLMEHSCVPNTRLVYTSASLKLTVLANQPIAQ